LIKGLITTYAKKRDGLLAGLCKFESGELRRGAAELGTLNDDISQQWMRQQNIWIADLKRSFGRP
jgi:hypothetical protein